MTFRPFLAPIPRTAGALLDEAADLIEAGGLTRGRYADAHGGSSIEGALQAAARRARQPLDGRPFRDAVVFFLDEIEDDRRTTDAPGRHPLSSWNDHRVTTPETAVRRLRGAARFARSATW